MDPSVIVDGVVVFLLLFALIDGWRHGMVGSVFSFIGIAAGLVIGFALAPLAMQQTESNQLRIVIAVTVLVMASCIGYFIGGTAGASLREKVTQPQLRRVDSLAGAFFQVMVVLIVAWLLATPLAEGNSRLAKGVRNSTVLQQVDTHSPRALAALTDKLRVLLNDSGMPMITSPFQNPKPEQVQAPRIEVSDVAMVERVRPSVVHIIGEAPQCQRRLMGSGFVVAPDRIMTNAHVVAGTNEVDLDTVLGFHTARVVYYNPVIDIAILATDGLGIDPLPWAEGPAESGADAVVMGFPESGPFEAAPARIIDSLLINSPTIYADQRIDREVYTVRGSIREGNSGGPLLSEDGHVLGMVFGAAADDTDTGYALTRAEVEKHVAEATSLDAPVNTGACVVG